ncbi:MAG TPA: protease inhibitor I42 family protein [Polyangiaceae bacterium]|nr:protease inhibitor I42 family protein [Polyangiaceae bacterium]
MQHDDDGFHSIVVAVGQIFAIELMAETSAGYEWIPILDSTTISYLGQEAVIGVGGDGAIVRRLTFRALVVGEHHPLLLYKRRWERAVRKRLTLSIRVTPAV